ncbi:GMC family oxidoreductase [Chitinophaga pendula]|uniref:GMC family oxidoreductase n=1 Tax=Chitinophaga TaxID=79328 RepID=UPI000BAEC698|nr:MULTISPECIES: GMC family oxidoreductase [Chitinophaga]ASZ14478.1 choline dehydrogenase [Chitinophaga sp. MD30]UCJ07865.1 GMC family oxidoreductase [Chitinophaga pendula]
MNTSNKEYDVVIVGGGWAGSLLAYKLAAANKTVLVLESGVAIDGVTSSDDNDQPETYQRGDFMETFYLAMAKTPESPYVQNYNAPRPSVLDIRTTAEDDKIPDNCNQPVKSIDTKGYFIQKGPMPFGSTYERRGGGTSWHWLGTSLRLLPKDFKMASEYKVGVDWPMKYEDLSPYYDEAEYEIGVSADVEEQAIHGITFSKGYVYPMAKIPPTLLDVAMTTGLKNFHWQNIEMKVTGTPAGRNGTPNKMKDGTYYDNGRRQCQGNTNCTPICPIQAKYDATISMKKALMTGNVDIMYQAVAYDIKIDKLTQQVTGIMYKTYETINGGVKDTGVVTGKKYVIAANAIEAAKLLLMSNAPFGVANGSGQVGKNLMDHPVYLAWGLMPKSTFPFRGPLSTSGIETTRDGDFRKTRAAFRIEIGNEGWNWPGGAPYTQLINIVSPGGAVAHGDRNSFGSGLRKQIQKDFTRQFRIGFLMEQLPDANNYIVPSKKCMDNLGIPRPEIHYDLNKYTREGFKAAADAAKAIFSQLKVENANTPPVATGGQFKYDNVTYYSQGAGHVMGTHRMGFNKYDSVTNADMKSWDHDNLYIVGCGSFPTTATANPTLTMSALCFKAADAIIKSF